MNISMWIERKYSTEYSDCPARGLRLKFYDGFDPENRRKLTDFCNFLRKAYFFPICVYVCMVNVEKFPSPDAGHTYFGIFYDNGDCKRKTYPRICVAAHFESDAQFFDVCYTIVHELTHYFQWYFLEDDKRSDRSLEIEANRWADYLTGEYFAK